MIKFSSYSQWTSKKGGYSYYDWCVFVDEPPEVLATIRELEYTLHPTFSDPVRRTNDKESLFAVMSSGWGEFDIRIIVRYFDDKETTATFFLELDDDSWPKLAPETALPEESAKIYEQLPTGDKHRWRKTSTIIRSTGLPQAAVLDVLEDLEAVALVRRAPFKALDDEELWGSTAVVGVPPLNTHNQ